MSYRQHPTKGQGFWQVFFRPAGSRKPLVYVVEGTEVDALEFDTMLKLTKHNVKSVNHAPRISDTIVEYIEYYRLDHLDVTNVTRNLLLWKNYVGDMLFSQVGPDIITRFKLDRLEMGIKPTTINKELSALSGLLKWAKRKGYLLTVPEVERFSAKKTKAPLPDVPTREEVLALIHAMKWPACGFFACLYYAGMRSAEARELRAEDVYLDRRLMIVTGKGNKQRVVPIVDELLPWLVKRLGEVETGIMWTTRTGARLTDVKLHVRYAKRRAGITRRIYPHLLRHAFGTHSTQAGVNLRTLQYAMGHTSSKTTEIYTTLGHNAIVDEITGKFGKG